MTPSFPKRRSSDLHIEINDESSRMRERGARLNRLTRPNDGNLRADLPVLTIIDLDPRLGALQQGLGDDEAKPHAFMPTLLIDIARSEEHTSELQSLIRITYAVFCLKKTNQN